MSELTWEQVSLLHADVIEGAAEYWSTYIGQMAEAAEAIGTDVPKTIAMDHFDSQVGEDCRTQLANISGEFQDHLDESANRIKVILLEAHEGLAQSKADMLGLVDEVLAAQLRIKPDGEVYIADSRYEAIKEWARQKADAEGGTPVAHALEEVDRIKASECEPMTERVRGVVEAARGHDEDFTAQLNAIRDAWFAMPPPLGSDWHEDVAQYWADQAVDLLNGGADGEMSAEELDEFNELVEARGDNPVFATALMNTLGADGMMTNVADIVDNVYGVDPEGTYSAEQVDRMYEALGTTLATATNTTKEPHVDEAWVSDLMNLGGSDVATSDGHWKTNGYQLLAPMLPHSTFHEDFLVPVTEHMMALDNSQNWHDGPPLSAISGLDSPHGSNPLNYALEAIDHNPSAALNLFTEGGTGLDDIEGVDLGDARPVEDPFAYLMERSGEYGVHNTTVNPDLFGDALESATTGVSTDPDYAPQTTPLHSNYMADLTDRLVDYATDNPDKFTGEPLNAMVDNFGGITAAYIDDFQAALASPGTEDWAVDQRGIGLGIGAPGEANADLASEWMQIIGHDEAATAQVWGASEALMYGQLEASLEYDDQGLGQSNEAFEMHGRLTAALTVGTLDAIADGVHAKAADQNMVVDAFAEGAKYGTGVLIGYGTANPWVGTAGGQFAGYGIDYVADFARMTKEEAAAELETLAQREVEANASTMRSPETLAQVEAILRTDTSLSEENIQTALDNYYERYWDNVGMYAEEIAN